MVSKKNKILIIIIFLLVAVILFSFVQLYKEKNYWQKDAAEYNRYHWIEINLMAKEIEELGFTKEAIEELYPYINAKIFSSTTGIYPAFDGDVLYTSFLQTYYVQLAMDIKIDKDSTDEKLTEALALFEDTTKALKELTQDILEMTEDEKSMIALRKVDSDTYNKAEKMIIEYCNTYGSKISEFNQSRE